MDQVTHDVRLANWKRIIDECNHRPEGMSAAQWIRENNVPEKSYYYWQRIIRRELASSMDNLNLPVAQNTETDVCFAEVPVVPSVPASTKETHPTCVIKTGAMTIELSNEISPELLRTVLRRCSMLTEAYGIVDKVYIAVGYTDLRKGIDGLAQLVGSKYDLNPYNKGTLFLFCGRSASKMKGLLWEGDGFLLLYKRLEDGSFSWPRSEAEVAELTEEQYTLLMKGLNPLHPKIREVHPKNVS